MDQDPGGTRRAEGPGATERGGKAADPGATERGGDSRSSWERQRRHAISVHAEAQQRRVETEAGQAATLIARFARDASAAGLRPTALTARTFNGRSRYRTGLRGWYLKPDRSVAVSLAGDFYILAVPANLTARLRGARLSPERPGLTIGEGARDGESVPLRTLLQLRLDAGNDWP